MLLIIRNIRMNDLFKRKLRISLKTGPLAKCYSNLSVYRLMHARRLFFHLLTPFSNVGIETKRFDSTKNLHFLMRYCSLSPAGAALSVTEGNSLNIEANGNCSALQMMEGSLKGKRIRADNNEEAVKDLEKEPGDEIKVSQKKLQKMENELLKYSVSTSQDIEEEQSDTPDIEYKKEIIRKKVEERRKWFYTDYGQKHLKKPQCGLEFTIMSYNILSQYLLEDNNYLYYHCDEEVLDWNYRAQNLLREIQESNTDIICLQEIQEDHFYTLFQPRLEMLGYYSLFKKKTGNKCDGCAIFFKKYAFTLETHVAVEYRNKKAQLLDRDNIGLIALLRPNCRDAGDLKLCVATTHLIFNPKRGDVKLSQLRVLLAEIDMIAFKKFSSKNQPVYHSIILCGDMNSEPFSPLYKFITCGTIRYKDMLSGNISGQREGINRGRIMAADDLVFPDLGINEGSQYESHIADRNKKWFPGQTNVSSDATSDSSFISQQSKFNNQHYERLESEDSVLETLSNSKCLKSDINTPEVKCGESDVNNAAISCASDIGDNHNLPDQSKEKDSPESTHNTGYFRHHLNFVSTYNHYTETGIPEVTTQHSKANCTVDYIFYSVKYKRSYSGGGKVMHKNKREGPLKLLGYYSLLSGPDVKEYGGLPNAHLSSDHLSLTSRFFLKFS